MKNVRLCSTLLSALCALPLIACAGGEEVDPIVVDPSAPITALSLANGNQLEFYEPSPGMLLVSEVGVAGVAPMAFESKSSVELYQRLRPGQPVPAALVSAQRRADALPPGAAPKLTATKTPGAQRVVDTGEHSYIDNEHCDDAWFNNSFCVGSYDWTTCLLNVWDGASVFKSSVDYVYHAACADIGNITLRVVIGDGSGGNWTVTEGTYRTFSWRDNCVFGCNKSSDGDILNATDNRFHYSVRVNY
jgi:hypothetical protein